MFQGSRLRGAAALAFAGAVSLHALAGPDTIPATGGSITIQPIAHAALQLTFGTQVITT